MTVVRSILHNLVVTMVGFIVALIGTGLDKLLGVGEFRSMPAAVVGALKTARASPVPTPAGQLESPKPRLWPPSVTEAGAQLLPELSATIESCTATGPPVAAIPPPTAAAPPAPA